ncbi:hypothetical protein JYU34_014929 [Plutella xylostella]|uniref:Uncharacterized protein n=1 Tax=Plutella xylostella TaxID=51655 RepID=A0ABQ7Q694_PLUXY|nr:hypothetical protein JYU34_014929 [Plutella xylostella]
MTLKSKLKLITLAVLLQIIEIKTNNNEDIIRKLIKEILDLNKEVVVLENSKEFSDEEPLFTNTEEDYDNNMAFIVIPSRRTNANASPIPFWLMCTGGFLQRPEACGFF